jgi:hypothetical protein
MFAAQKSICKSIEELNTFQHFGRVNTAQLADPFFPFLGTGEKKKTILQMFA